MMLLEAPCIATRYPQDEGPRKASEYHLNAQGEPVRSEEKQPSLDVLKGLLQRRYTLK